METNKQQLQQAVQQVKKFTKNARPIMLLQWDEKTRNYKFAIDVMKYVTHPF
jgi:biopolymer transport protein ExbD